jgi:hypothetical protein
LSVIGHFQENAPPGTVQALTPSNPVTPLSSDPSRYDTMSYAVHESEGAQVEEAVMEREKEIDPLDVCLPPPPKEKCSEELQVSSFLSFFLLFLILGVKRSVVFECEVSCCL